MSEIGGPFQKGTRIRLRAKGYLFVGACVGSKGTILQTSTFPKGFVQVKWDADTKADDYEDNDIDELHWVYSGDVERLSVLDVIAEELELTNGAEDRSEPAYSDAEYDRRSKGRAASRRQGPTDQV